MRLTTSHLLFPLLFGIDPWTGWRQGAALESARYDISQEIQRLSRASHLRFGGAPHDQASEQVSGVPNEHTVQVFAVHTRSEGHPFLKLRGQEIAWVVTVAIDHEPSPAASATARTSPFVSEWPRRDVSSRYTSFRAAIAASSTTQQPGVGQDVDLTAGDCRVVGSFRHRFDGKFRRAPQRFRAQRRAFAAASAMASAGTCVSSYADDHPDRPVTLDDLAISAEERQQFSALLPGRRDR